MEGGRQDEDGTLVWAYVEQGEGVVGTVVDYCRWLGGGGPIVVVSSCGSMALA